MTVVIYTADYCPYCHRAKALLQDKGIAYTEIRVDKVPDKRREMEQLSNRHTVPQILINDVAIGGCDDLYALEHNGKLDRLINES